MNGIMFLVGGWTVGGVERVTVSLANELSVRGYKIVVATFKIVDDKLSSQLAQGVSFIELPNFKFQKECATQIEKMVSDYCVRWIVNERPSYRVARFLSRLPCRKNISLISYKHTQPDSNSFVCNAKFGIIKSLLRWVTLLTVRYVYGKSDCYVVLANAYADMVRAVCGCGKGMIRVVNNPLLVRSAKECKKANVILYVGRLQESVKRISRVIEIWQKIYMLHPDWRLEIVGDGQDRAAIEVLAGSLERVSFYGFKDPVNYYARSKILLLTSDFEGYPLSPIEAMSNGCVPVVFNSFLSANEIVKNEFNGLLIDAPYDVDSFSQKVHELILSHERLAAMGVNGRKCASKYGIENIANKWEKILKEVMV